MRRAAPSRVSGFTLIEVLISLVLITLALTLAAQLLVESRLLLEDSNRRARDPVLTLAVSQLRNDLQGSASAVGGGAWSSGPLVLTGLEVGTVTYAVSGDALERRVVNSLGVESSRREVLKPLKAWRWRAVNARLVDVELVVDEQNPVPRLRTGPTPRNPREQRWALRSALRSGERERSW
jgi:prepilin-type N-terminal cleavage/methylation domain-containing protein